MINSGLELIGLDTLKLSQLVCFSTTCNIGNEVDEFLVTSALKRIRYQQLVNTTHGVIFLNPRV